jgi:hypothetical protein
VPAANAPPLSSEKDELTILQDKLRIAAKIGHVPTDEEFAYYQAEEKRRAEAPERKRLIKERAQDERDRIAAENRKISQEQFGKRIFLSINHERVDGLNADGSVPCPACGGDFAPATDALLQVANMLRGNPDPYNLLRSGGFGACQSVPCIHTSGHCPHCGTAAEILVQMVV